MSAMIDLPARCTCLFCFSDAALERRTAKNGLIYYKCGLCSQRIWLYSPIHKFALAYWAQMLSDPAVSKIARDNLEVAMRQAGMAAHAPARPVQTEPVPTQVSAGRS